MPISTFTGVITNQTTTLVNARELHERLQVSTKFQDWITRRISEYKFVETLDFIEVLKFENVERGFFGTREIEVKDYHLTLDMAKELCMLERSELGRQARRYFIEMEKQASLEIPRLQAENQALKQQLVSVPAFMRNHDLHMKLLNQAISALFLAYPECKEIMRYRDMGLTNAEIGKLLSLGKKSLEVRLNKLFELGLVERKAQNQHTQPAQLQLGLNA